MERTTMGRGEGPDGAVEVPNALGFRSFAGNVRMGLGAAFMATACTLAWARHTEKRRKAERSPRLRAAMGLRPED